MWGLGEAEVVVYGVWVDGKALLVPPPPPPPQVGQVKGRKCRSFFTQPVRAKVRGGYTIAPHEEYKLQNSPESLITCIIKVGRP